MGTLLGVHHIVHGITEILVCLVVVSRLLVARRVNLAIQKNLVQQVTLVAVTGSRIIIAN